MITRTAVLIFCLAWTAAAGQTSDGYRTDYDYPGQGDAWYGGTQLPDANRDYEPSLLDEVASGEDYCLGYEKLFDNLTLGPPLYRTYDYRSAYEFRFTPGPRTEACIGATMQCTATTPPGEVPWLVLERWPENSVIVEMTWGAVPGAEVYNIYRDWHADLSDLTCLSPGNSDTSWTEGQHVNIGYVLYFLVSAVNCVGESSLGQGTFTPRMPVEPCF